MSKDGGGRCQNALKRTLSRELGRTEREQTGLNPSWPKTREW